MDFFDNIGKRISMAGQTAVQKTKEVTEIAKITSAISEEEKKVNNLYYQIGKLYFAIHAFDYETDFGGMINGIKESEVQIAEYRQQIQDLKGVVRCENCGAEMSGVVAFCTSCGTPMPKKINMNVEEMIKCSHCGSMVAKDMRFCTSCGKPMIIPSPNSQTEQATSTEHSSGPVEEVVTQPTSKNCHKCGTTLALDALFCFQCGEKQEQ